MRALVTGGTGFVGAALCRELVLAGHDVVVFDNNSRGSTHRLEEISDAVEIIEGDVRDPADVRVAVDGCEVVWHLAYINGTRFFYDRPDDVLEVGVKGTLNVIEAAIQSGARRLVMASTSETYNEPTRVPTPESEPLKIPDVTNPRFSYGGGKIACELLALHLGGRRGLETVIFRPHNFYGPDMGHEHVIPEISRRIVKLSDGLRRSAIQLPIEGDGTETRSFCFVSDGARGSFVAGEKGGDGEIYHVGDDRETTIAHLVAIIGDALGVTLEIVPGERRVGGALRRCPDISKLASLGYAPMVALEDGVSRTARWYAEHFMGEMTTSGASHGA